MCQKCRVSVGHVLNLMISATVISLEAAEKGIAEGDPNAPTMTPKEQAGAAIGLEGMRLMKTLGEIFVDRDLTDEERVVAIQNLVADDPERRTSVGALIFAAQFAHYAPQLLQTFAASVMGGLVKRATEEYDHKAIDWVLSPEGREMHQRLMEDNAPEDSLIAMMASGQARVMQVPQEQFEEMWEQQNGKNGKKSEPDYQH